MNRYYKISDYFRTEFQQKYVKLSLDGGFTCPNRDGTLDTRGCIFCSGKGSGEFAGCVDGVHEKENSISDQLSSQKALLSKKWKGTKFIGYYQNFTNTYSEISKLDFLYAQPFLDADVEGLVIATRPDCIDEDVIALLSQYNSKKVFWIELGLQTIHEFSAIWMRRHYSLDVFEETFNKLSARNIKVVVHLIVGIPGETKENFLETIQYVSKLKPFGVKIQMLNVLKDTDLEKMYNRSAFSLLSESEYIEWICDALELLDARITIHRLTGDGAHDVLVAPQWIKNKRSVLNGIEKSLKQRNSVQGSKC